jgi:exosome complex exonuclease DIS3/RRP44
MKVQVELDEWCKNREWGYGHLRRIIGEKNEGRTEGEVILLEHNVDTREFSKKVLQCLP